MTSPVQLPSLQQLQQELSQYATGERDMHRTILEWFETVQFIGVAGLQAAPYNLTATQATNFFNAANYLQTMAQVFFGTAAQTPAFNFDNQLGQTLGVYGGN